MNIEKIIKKIVSTQLFNGVQPSEIISSIFDSEYISINSKKTPNNDVKLAVIFHEEHDNKKILNTMVYTYNHHSYLQRIEQKIGDKEFSVQWDRYEILQGLYDQLKKLFLLQGVSTVDIENLIQQISYLDQYSAESIIKMIA